MGEEKKIAIWWKNNSWPIKTFLLSRLGLFLLAYLSLILIPVVTGEGFWRAFPHNLFLDGWSRWDSGWYIDIAQNGYSDVLQNVYRNVAFFPLYPLLIKVIQFLIGNFHTAGLLISNLALITACVYLYQLILEKYGENIARKSLLLLLLNPFSFYFSAVYTESLFFLLVVLVFYFGMRKKWVLAALCSALAGATRLVGILTVLPLLFLYFESIEFKWRNIRANILWLTLCVLGLGGFMLFQGLKFSDPLLFIKSLYAPGWKEGVNLYSALDAINISLSWQALKTGEYPFIYLFNILSLLVGISILIVSRRNMHRSWWIWSLATVLVSIPGWNSGGRYIMVVFPLFVGTALLFKNKGFNAVLYISSVLLSLFTILFSHWYWVG